MTNKITFMMGTKQEQLSICLVKLGQFVTDEKYEYAEQLKGYITNYQANDFDLDNVSDYIIYLKLVNMLF